jgi:D-threo-aldose 1-dehydrogenase
MKSFATQRLPLGDSGLDVPPIVFGTAALANLPYVIPEQRKLEICAAWFQNIAPPVFVDVAYSDGEGIALELLGRMLRRLDIAGEEVVVHLTAKADQLADDWDKSCRLLGTEYTPKLISLRDANENAWRAAHELKVAGSVRGLGVIATDLGALNSFTPSADWALLTRGFTLLRHSADVLSSMETLAAQQIPIIVSGVFDGGFLVGSNRLDGRRLNGDDPAHRSRLAWRSAFAALCHGHGVAPAQTCIQFVLAAPGVVAVQLDSSRPERVAENVEFVQRKVPDAFWASMKEEGLLAADYPLGT